MLQLSIKTDHKWRFLTRNLELPNSETEEKKIQNLKFKFRIQISCFSQIARHGLVTSLDYRLLSFNFWHSQRSIGNRSSVTEH